YLDPDRPLAELRIGAVERILQEGEWSDWLPVDFALAPGRRLHGMCRFHLKEIRPAFRLYVTPINIDPADPAMPVSAPASWARELAAAQGRFYTQGMPEDTKAYSSGVFSRQDFLSQARLANDENVAQYRWTLDRYRRGLLFYYFGHVDLVSHMLWR